MTAPIQPLVVQRPLNERRTSETNPTYKLTPEDRDHMYIMWACGLWSNTAIGKAFGVDRSIVYRTSQSRSIQ